MGKISSHVLDTAIGKPAKAILVRLEYQVDGQSWELLSSDHTNQDGRINQFNLGEISLKKGVYRLCFALEDYYKQQQRDSFYPEAHVLFRVEHPEQHYHVPLLLSGFGYATYRGS